VNENVITQASGKEKAFGKENAPDKVGSFLDSAEEIRQGTQSPPRQAHICQALMAQAEIKGLKWQTLNALTQYPCAGNG
jgi:hypothetical protein